MAARGAAITGWSGVLPDKVLTNHDLEQTLDTSDEWIVERSGIRERRIVPRPGEDGTGPTNTAELAVAASQQALTSAGLSAADIDLLILATTTPDQTVPATSAHVADLLGLQCGAFDI